MKKITYLIAILTLAIGQLKAQSMVDPGVSIYNYKHPNKAAKAKASGKDVHTVPVANYRTVERYSRFQNAGRDMVTPKYAPQPAALVVVRQAPIQKMELNPLRSPANYKTFSPNREARQNEVADNTGSLDSLSFPTVD